ncbi:hypothetical protein SLS55_007678 [Diplodia seriata]|uniref:F-box domain-containing protein n=1 Tax=Diplodia seriata TaxID=420778 RepID=A0ABR3CBN3_9PEZI
MMRNTSPKSEHRRPTPEPKRQQPPAVSLNDLPEELIEQIAHYLNNIPPTKLFELYTANPEPRFLHPFSSVSRKFHRIATPLLYSFYIDTGPRRPAALHQFVLTILRNPDLAACVRTVVFQNLGAYEGCSSPYPLRVRWAKGAKAEIIARARQIDFGDDGQISSRRDWLDRLECEGRDAITFLLLTQTPNLETLDLETAGAELAGFHHFMTTWMREAHNLQGVFANLRHVVLGDAANYAGYDHLGEDKEWVFLLPPLRTLELCDKFLGSRIRYEYMNRPWSIETLIIRAEIMTPLYWKLLVGSCKEIKHLVYRLHDQSWNNGGMTTDDMYDVLLAHRDHLETLVLDTPLLSIHARYILPIGSFRDFRRLRHLSISGIILLYDLDLDLDLGLDLVLKSSPLGYDRRPLRSDSALVLVAHGRSLCQDFFPQSLQTLCVDLTSLYSDMVTLVCHVTTDIYKGRSDGWLRDLRSVQFTVSYKTWNSKDLFEKLCKAGIQMMQSGIDEYMIHVVPRNADDMKAGKVSSYSLGKDGEFMAAGQTDHSNFQNSNFSVNDGL